MAEYAQELNFDYVNLNDVDPTMQPIPNGPYKLRLVKANVVSGEAKTTGKPWRRYEVAVQVLDHETLAGRRVYDSFFFDPQKPRNLRKIMDATGVQQNEGEELAVWFARLPDSSPEFKAVIGNTTYEDKLGNVKPKNTIDFGSITVAD